MEKDNRINLKTLSLLCNNFEAGYTPDDLKTFKTNKPNEVV